MSAIPETKRNKGHEGQPEHTQNIRDCRHMTLCKVEESGINDVDTDVLVYRCSTCGKTYTDERRLTST
jgi:predicted SprT family Zn-dependent metalloprotease